ncbi:MAG: hypothetical protein NXI16_13220 [Alphaproteobacteria bacterium]|nr:hypothetical protein [Alphaproteobacteria bacterium]
MLKTAFPLRLAVPATLAGSLLLAACATPDPTPRYAEITFASQPTIQLSVSRIDATSPYQEPGLEPNVEHLAPVSFKGEAMEWAAERLTSAGGLVTATLVIEDASIVKEDLKTDQGLTGAFKTEQAERYTASVRARVEIREASGAQRGVASAFAQRSSTLPEDRTLLDQERLLHALIADSLADLDLQMEQAIRDNLPRYVVRQ